MDKEPLRRACELAESWLGTLPERPVALPVDAVTLRARLGPPLAEEGEDPAKVVGDLAAALDPGLVAIPGPRYFGFVNGGALPAALATDWLVSAFDQNAAMAVMSPAASAVEEVAAEWLLDLLGLPATAGVGFVTGAQMANFSCLAAARHDLLASVGWDVEADGLTGAPGLAILVGEHAHTAVLQALRMLGLGAARARRVPADSQGRMMPGGLRDALRECTGPALVCAQAGEVNTGSVDPLREIAAEVAVYGNAWLHVDGAFGLWAAASPALRSLVDGAGLAQSWAVDAHKWLNVPYDCGMAIVADPAALTAALSLTAPYLRGNGARDGLAYTPEASRRARGLPVYAALRSLGRRGVADLVERCCMLARQAAAGIAAIPGAVVLNDVVLNQVLFRVTGADTSTVISHIQRDGTCWLGGTTWQGEPAVRFSVSNWSTTPADIGVSVAAIARAASAAQA